MAHRVSAGGSYRIDKVFPPPVGRLALASGTTTKAALRNVVACLDRLAERGRLDVLEALKNHDVTVAQVLDADRQERLDALLASDNAPLWPAVEAWLGPEAARGQTMKRYGVSWKKVRRFEVLPADAPVSALQCVDWKALGQRWTGPGCSASDWNHMRRAVSHFLTCHLGDLFHPLRRAIVKSIPKRPEPERIPDLDAPTFWRVVAAAPEHVRPAFVTIVALGLRVGEYLRLRDTDLHPITKSVTVPPSKGKAATVLQVDQDLWPWLVAAVPSPVEYHRLWTCWKAALKAVGADVTLRIHDLRHTTAQLLVNAGRSEASVQTTMRQSTASMTRRYARQKDRRENAATLARVLLEARTA